MLWTTANATLLGHGWSTHSTRSEILWKTHLVSPRLVSSRLIQSLLISSAYLLLLFAATDATPRTLPTRENINKSKHCEDPLGKIKMGKHGPQRHDNSIEYFSRKGLAQASQVSPDSRTR